MEAGRVTWGLGGSHGAENSHGEHGRIRKVQRSLFTSAGRGEKGASSEEVSGEEGGLQGRTVRQSGTVS